MDYIILGNKPTYEKDFCVENETAQKLYSLRFKNTLNDLFKDYLIDDMKIDNKQIQLNSFTFWSTVIYYDKKNDKQIEIVKYVIDNLPQYWNNEIKL